MATNDRIPMMYAGDFRQILPIVKKAKCLSKISFNHCLLWLRVKQFTLSENMRLSAGNADWAEFLLKLGKGKVATDTESNIELPEQIMIVNTPSKMVQEVFFENIEEQYFDSCAIICAKNDNIDEINVLIISQMFATSRQFLSVNELSSDETSLIPVE